MATSGPKHGTIMFK